MNYYPHHIGDYITDTAHLTMIEDGAYRRMLDLYYSREQPLTSDKKALYRLLRARSPEEQEAVDVVLDEFFIESEDGWTHSRCEAEIEKAHAAGERARTNGKNGGRPRKQKPTENPEKNPSDEEENPPETQSVISGFSKETQTKPTDNPEQKLPIANNQEPIPKEHPSTPRKRGNGFDALTVPLPAEIPPEAWAEWVADRKARRKPVTEKAAGLQIAQLQDFARQGIQPADVIRHSIACGYQGLFPPRTAPLGKQTNADRNAAWTEELRAELGKPQRVERDMGVIDASH